MIENSRHYSWYQTKTRDHHEQIDANKLDNLEEMDKFLDIKNCKD